MSTRKRIDRSGVLERHHEPEHEQETALGGLANTRGGQASTHGEQKSTHGPETRGADGEQATRCGELRRGLVHSMPLLDFKILNRAI